MKQKTTEVAVRKMRGLVLTVAKSKTTATLGILPSVRLLQKNINVQASKACYYRIKDAHVVKLIEEVC